MILKTFKKSRDCRFLSIQLLLLFSLIFCGCSAFDNGRINNIDISGYVFNIADSSAVPGALIHFSHNFTKSKFYCGYAYTDSLGYFEHFCTQPTAESSVGLETTLVLIDDDQAENGVFLTRDTTLYEDNLDSALTIVFEVIFYVEMIEEYSI